MTNNNLPASASQLAARKEPVAVSAPAPAVSAALSIPIADVSIRSRPELLEQLARIYRSQLADDPNNATARSALNQLQERSLSELQTIIVAGDESTAVKSMEIVSRLFPEVADSVRYKYLAARVDRLHSQEKAKPVVASESPDLEKASSERINSEKTNSEKARFEKAMPPTATALPEVISTGKNISAATNSANSSSANSSVAIAKPAEHARAAEEAPSSKPEIRAVSITPGAMIHDRFVPDVEGNALMVEVSYRNFGKIAGESEVSLVARLGVPGYSNVLAEAPVEILGDRGTKSFVMTTLMPADDAKEYKLNFIVNGEFLASRTVRLSR